MKPQLESSTQEVLAGLVERVTFHNVENGFCVLRAKARGHRELVTVVGHAAIISAGEWIRATGDWINDRTSSLREQSNGSKCNITWNQAPISAFMRWFAGFVPCKIKAAGHFLSEPCSFR